MWEAVKARRRTIGLALCGASLYTVVVLATPLVARNAIDNVVVDDQRDQLTGYIVAILALGVVRGFAGAMRKYQATKGPAFISNDLRRRLYEHFQRLSFSFHDRMGAGQLMARASTDITALEQALNPVPWAIQSTAMFVFGVVILVLIQPVLAAVGARRIVALPPGRYASAQGDAAAGVLFSSTEEIAKRFANAGPCREMSFQWQDGITSPGR